MAWFTNKEAALKEITELNASIAGLRAQLKSLETEEEKTDRVKKLEKEQTLLKGQIETLKMEKNRIEEEHDRKRRDTEHAIGLLKIQQEHEAQHARKSAALEVREANLEHEKTQFDTQMAFQKEEFGRQATYLQSLMEQVLQRLPNVNYEITEERTRGEAKELEAGPTPRRTRRSPAK